MTTQSSCTCTNVVMGSYANQEVRALPFATERYPEVGTKMVGIDRCILPDVEYLWSQGIQTDESCCGHGQATGYIYVRPEGVSQMRALGYENDSNHPGRPEIFRWPRTFTRDVEAIANDLTDLEREWITGWQGPAGAAFNCVAGDLLRKGLLKSLADWGLNETGLAVRNFLTGQQ